MINESKKIFSNYNNIEEYKFRKLNNNYKNINKKIMELRKRISNLEIWFIYIFANLNLYNFLFIYLILYLIKSNWIRF